MPVTISAKPKPRIQIHAKPQQKPKSKQKEEISMIGISVPKAAKMIDVSLNWTFAKLHLAL